MTSSFEAHTPGISTSHGGERYGFTWTFRNGGR